MSVEIEKEKSEVIDKSPVLVEDLGMRFPTEGSKQKTRYGLFRCGYCGNEFEAQIANIKNSNIKSCGCIINKNKITHGLAQHRLYSTWANMIKRCYNPNATNYKNYGGRGITVCDEWRDSLEQFIGDMSIGFVEGLTLDRIDNDKGYSKENCRWATRSEQTINQRIRKDNTSGFIGVCWHTRGLVFDANIGIDGKLIFLGRYPTALEAAIVRNNYIIENNLPHKLNIIPKQEEGENIA